jgi:hypothetical protein
MNLVYPTETRGKMTLVHHSDSGHGWIAVPKYFIAWLELNPSRYSFINNNIVYLEEDKDALDLFSALTRRNIEVHIMDNHVNGNSVIRTYERISDVRYL